MPIHFEQPELFEKSVLVHGGQMIDLQAICDVCMAIVAWDTVEDHFGCDCSSYIPGVTEFPDCWHKLDEDEGLGTLMSAYLELRAVKYDEWPCGCRFGTGSDNRPFLIMCSMHEAAPEILHRSRPSWDDAPEWARFLAMDEDGTWCWWQKSPRPLYDKWEPQFDKISWVEHAKINGWEQTIEPRPDDEEE